MKSLILFATAFLLFSSTSMAQQPTEKKTAPVPKAKYFLRCFQNGKRIVSLRGLHDIWSPPNGRFIEANDDNNQDIKVIISSDTTCSYYPERK
jgi:hypothetical protein